MLQSDPREIPKSLKSNNQKSRPHMETTTTTTTKKSSNQEKERQKKREELGGFWRSRKKRARAAAEAAQTAVVWLCGMRLHPIFILTYYLSDIP
jgi:hypothetical protein